MIPDYLKLLRAGAAANTVSATTGGVTFADNRSLVYAGCYSLLDRPDESEELLSTKARVLDQVP